MLRAGFLAIALSCVGSVTAQAETWWCAPSHAFFPSATTCPAPWHLVQPPLLAPFLGPPERQVFRLPDGSYGLATSSELESVEAEGRAMQAEQTKKAQAEQAAQQRANADAEKQRQVRIAGALKAEKDRGYRRITFEDFQLDGKALAASQDKISISGVYVKQGEMERVFPSAQSVFIAQSTYKFDVAIPVLTEDASRTIRKYFLDCRNGYPGSVQGCPIVALGRATICVVTNIVGSRNVPCLAVEDGWWQ